MPGPNEAISTPETPYEKVSHFIKSAGGPGSGVSRDNTYRIADGDLLPSPFREISIGRRKGFMASSQPQDNIVEVAKIKYRGQEKYVPEKLVRLQNAMRTSDVAEKPVHLLRDDAGDLHTIDGHHRVLAAKRLGIKELKAKVYSMEKRAFWSEFEKSAKVLRALRPRVPHWAVAGGLGGAALGAYEDKEDRKRGAIAGALGGAALGGGIAAMLQGLNPSVKRTIFAEQVARANAAKGLPDIVLDPSQYRVIKEAFMKKWASEAFHHGIELAGLGTLAYHPVKTLMDPNASKKDKSHAKWEAAGLGILGAPSAYALGRKLISKGKA